MQRICSFLIVFLISQKILAQVDSLHINKPYLLSLEEDVLNLKVQNAEERKIFTASNRLEKVFETAVSTSIITAEEIKQSGATNLPEALRLSPELFVRQKTNGYYGVDIRGAFNIISDNQLPNFENTLLLVTINGVPINNFYQGGVFWESIPVDLNDIERIEIVRTPHTVLYGLGAGSGVVNIVTKNVDTKRLKVHAHLQGGVYNTYAQRGDASFSASDKLQFRVSGYYNSRSRFQDPYYIFAQKKYLESDSLLFYNANAEKTNAVPTKALQRSGFNAYAFYQINPRIGFEVSAFTQNSGVQSVLQKIGPLALTNRSSKTNLINLRSKLYNLSTNFSYQSGIQDLAVGYDGFEMEVENMFLSTDYNYLNKTYHLKVGTSYSANTYNNLISPTRLVNSEGAATYLDKIILGKTSMSDRGVYLIQNMYLFHWKLRLLASGRLDYLAVTQRLHPTYQIASSYKIGAKSKNIIRSVFAKGLQGTFAQDYFSMADTLGAKYNLNKSLNPVSTETCELGYRVEPVSVLHADLTLFHSKVYDFVRGEFKSDLEQNVNNSLVAGQTGVTLDVDWILNKLKFKTFVTFQETKYKNLEDWHKDWSTPRYYGGLSCNYSMYLNKLKINANIYYYDDYSIPDQLSNYSILNKTITNFKLTYTFWDENTIYFNGRNILNNKNIEFPYADKIKSLYLIGVDLTF